MNDKIQLTTDQALQRAIAYAEIKNDDPVCTFSGFANGLHHFIVATVSLRYEFYVDAVEDEVLGISTEPLSYSEALGLCTAGEKLPHVA